MACRASTFIGAGEKHIIEQLRKVKTPVILVINKVDMVKKEEVLTFIDAYRKECDFAEIVPVSARRGDNTDELVNVIMKYLLMDHSSMTKIQSQTSRNVRL